MKRTFAWSLALGVGALLAACGNEGGGSGTVTTASAPATTATATATDTATATVATTATATASTAGTVVPAASGIPAADPSGTGAASGTATASGSATAAAKKFDCGEKGQKACPMQGWMKSVMGSAVASGDGDRLAKALDTVASKPVAGFGNWSSIASGGAAKARAGDIDGAKQSCKQCHDSYKHKYVTTMRDRPW